jgi:hypothetical protein
MSKKRYAEEQTIGFPKAAEAGRRLLSFADSTDSRTAASTRGRRRLLAWRGGDVRKLRSLEDEIGD